MEAAKEMADKGGKRMVDLTKANTPVSEIDPKDPRPQDPGKLRRSWSKIPITLTNELGFVVYETGVQSFVDYAPHVEYGTGLWGPKHAKYEIRPKTPGGVLAFRGRRGGPQGFELDIHNGVVHGGMVFAQVVHHPGSPGQHMVAIAAAKTEAEFHSLMEPVLKRWVTNVEQAWDRARVTR